MVTWCKFPIKKFHFFLKNLQFIREKLYKKNLLLPYLLFRYFKRLNVIVNEYILENSPLNNCLTIPPPDKQCLWHYYLLYCILASIVAAIFTCIYITHSIIVNTKWYTIYEYWMQCICIYIIQIKYKKIYRVSENIFFHQLCQ